MCQRVVLEVRRTSKLTDTVRASRSPRLLLDALSFENLRSRAESDVVRVNTRYRLDPCTTFRTVAG